MKIRFSESLHYQTILKWASRMFLIISILFALILVPLFVNLYNNISKLEVSKMEQSLNEGTKKISQTITGLLNISNMLQNDSDFSMLRYKKSSNITLPITTQNSMKKSLQNMILPYDSISQIALQNEKTVITDKTVFCNNKIDYYPTFFKVNDFSYDEWVDYLSSVGTGFTEVCHISTVSSSYDALIFVIPWANETYLYACIDVNNIKERIIDEESANDCYFTIESTNKTVLYTDLSKKISKYKTISMSSSAGNIKISVHIPNDYYHKNMRSFYISVAIYLILCISFFISINIIGTRQVTKPIINIINILEQSKNLKLTHNKQNDDSELGFEYILNIIMDADKNIGKYQNALLTQQKIVQARFFEKAINGQLVCNDDIQSFNLSFPNFPDNFVLVSIRFWQNSDKYSSTFYEEPMLLIQSFIQTELSVVYQQQITNTELLLLFEKDNYEKARETLEFLVSNINAEEPTFHVCCMASDNYNSVDNLSTAYHQLCTMNNLRFEDYQSHICTTSDLIENYKSTISVSNIMTLSTAIVSGNSNLALNKLAICSEELLDKNNAPLARPIFDIIKSILLYIEVSYPQTSSVIIPNFDASLDLYCQLSNTIKNYCAIINENSSAANKSFSQELFNYINEYFADPNISITTLKIKFNCSESTLRKSFKQVSDMSIAHYIEQKRMLLANELLSKGDKSVSEIATDCGYLLPHSFYKAYKRFYGHAPTIKE